MKQPTTRPARQVLPAAIARAMQHMRTSQALRELLASHIAKAVAPQPEPPAPERPPLDIQAMHDAALQRLHTWIEDEASRIAVTFAQLSRRQQRMVEVWRIDQPKPEGIAA